jgi:hypothetical protein
VPIALDDNRKDQSGLGEPYRLPEPLHRSTEGTQDCFPIDYFAPNSDGYLAAAARGHRIALA